MRVYHFVSTEHALTNISLQRLKIATFDDMNDPFELRGVNLKSAENRKGWDGFRNEIARRYGVICFSKVWSDPVLWSHYADRHRGLCLGFDVDDDLTVEVQYRATRFPQRRLADAAVSDALGEQLVIDVIRTKYDRWAYEQEIRILCRLEEAEPSGMHFAPIGERVKLTEVIIGAASDCARATISGALGTAYPDVEITNARLAFNGYHIVRQRARRQWR